MTSGALGVSTQTGRRPDAPPGKLRWSRLMCYGWGSVDQLGATLTIRIKVCGVRRAADVFDCIAAGVDAVGFNCWPRSPRYLPPAEAASLVASLPPPILR